jgi:hypothetical protein
VGVWSAWSLTYSAGDDNRFPIHSSSSKDVSDLCIKAANGQDGGETELGRTIEDIFQSRLERGKMKFVLL